MPRGGFGFLILLGLLCALIAVIQPGVPGSDVPEADFTRRGLRARAAEFKPHIEAVLGDALPWPVDIRISSPGELEEILAAETVHLMGELEGGMRGPALEQFAEAQARMLSRAIFGKVALETGALHILPDNFRWMSELTPSLRGLRGQGVVDVILIHELVHVYQNARFGLDRFFGKPATLGAFQGKNAVTEGHAQYVTRRVAERVGLTEAFDLAMLAIRGPDLDGLDSGSVEVLKALTRLTSFAYVEGESLLDAVCGEFGYETGVARVFRTPPTSTLMVSRPEKHLPWMNNRAGFERAVRRVKRYLGEDASSAPIEDVDGVRAGVTLEAGGRSVTLQLCVDAETARARAVAGLPAAGREDVAFDGILMATAGSDDGVVVGGPRGDIAYGIVAADRAAAIRLARRVLELVRASFEPSPWSGLTDRAEAQAAFLGALDDTHWGVRWRAVRNLGRFEPEVEGVEAGLRRALGDGEPIVRVAALRALKARGWANGDELADDPDWEIRAERN